MPDRFGAGEHRGAARKDKERQATKGYFSIFYHRELSGKEVDEVLTPCSRKGMKEPETAQPETEP